MIRLFQGSGSGEISFISDMDDAEWARYKAAAIKLLRTRKKDEAAEALEKMPFTLKYGSNCFGDEFSYLSAMCDIDLYVAQAAEAEDRLKREKYAEIAHVISEIGPYVRFVIIDLDDKNEQTLVSNPHLGITVRQVEEALADAEQLLKSRSPASAVDRVHTAFHGYLLEQCRKNNITVDREESITLLFKKLRETHLRLKVEIREHQEIDKICKALAVIIDCLNPIRNQHSRAHPNKIIINDDESLLVINSIRTLIHYLNSKL
jgi:hypothetical protein